MSLCISVMSSKLHGAILNNVPGGSHYHWLIMCFATSFCEGNNYFHFCFRKFRRVFPFYSMGLVIMLLYHLYHSSDFCLDMMTDF